MWKKVLASCLLAIAFTTPIMASDEPLTLDWIDLVPEAERKLFDSVGMPASDHSGGAAQQSKIGNVRPELNGSQVKIPGFVIPLEGSAPLSSLNVKQCSAISTLIRPHKESKETLSTGAFSVYLLPRTSSPLQNNDNNFNNSLSFWVALFLQNLRRSLWSPRGLRCKLRQASNASSW